MIIKNKVYMRFIDIKTLPFLDEHRPAKPPPPGTNDLESVPNVMSFYIILSFYTSYFVYDIMVIIIDRGGIIYHVDAMG